MLFITLTGQSCLDTLSINDTLFIQQKIGNCELSVDDLIAELGIGACPNIVVFPGGPFEANMDHEIELLDPANSARSTFILSLQPLPLSEYEVMSSGMAMTNDIIEFPLGAGECMATKDMILDQLQVADNDIIRSNIHFIDGTQRRTTFAIGDTNFIDLIECNGIPLYSDIKIVFTPQIATTSGFITFSNGLTTCQVTIEQVLDRLGYGSAECDISRFTISDSGPFGYGQTVIESIMLDGFLLADNATVEVTATGCPPTTIFYGILDEGKCFLDEYDILDTIGLTADGRDCNLENVVITPPGPYMETNTTITSITIDGVEVCGRAFDINYQLDNNIDEQITLFCNDDLNISMGPNCSVEIDADNILRSGAYCFLNYDIAIAFEDTPDDVVLSGHRIEVVQPGRYSVTITNPTSGNSCWSLMNVEDKYIEDIRCDPDTLRCYRVSDLLPDTSGIGPEFPILGGALTYELIGDETYNITGGTSCDITTASYVDTEVGQCQGPFRTIIDRLWTFEDANNNIDTCLQKIYIESAPISLLDRFEVYNGDCLEDFAELDANGYPSPEETGYPTVDTFFNADVCGNLKITYGDTPFALCGKSVKLARKWTVIDWCSDEVVYLDQIIRIEDTTAPIITDPVPDMTIDSDPFICGGTDIDLPLPNYEDCDADVTIEIQYETLDDDGNMILRSNGSNLRIPELRMNDIEADFAVIYILSDQCGNVSRDTTTITIQDTEPPVAVCDQFTVISVNGSGEALVDAFTFDDLSVDNCGIASYDARKLDGNCYVEDTFSPKIRFCCEEVGDTILVEFRVTDNAGNTNTCDVKVFIQDKFRPIIEPPADIIIDCGVDFTDTTITGFPTYRDNCSQIEIIYVDEVDLDACGQGTVTRSWSIIDRGGFEVVVTQLITIVEDNPFGLDNIQWPEDITVNGCQETLSPDVLGRPILNMQNCISVDASYTDLPFEDVEDACVKILREWTVVDWCQFNSDNSNAGIWKDAQIIKVVSDEGPVFDIRPIETFCIEDDECETEIMITGSATDGDACTPDDELIWTYQLYNRDTESILSSGDGSMVSAVLAEGSYAVIFEAVDGCDNAGIDTIRFEVADCAAPILDCPSVQPSLVLSTIGIASLDIEEILIGATDNCTNQNDITISFDKNLPIRSVIYNCDDIPDGISSVNFIQVYAWDANGNTDSCEIMVQLFDNSNNVCQDTLPPSVDTAMITGLVTTGNLMEIENVEVTLTNGLQTLTATTNEFGEYTIPDLTPGETYTTSLYKDGPILNGVSTADIVIIQRHLLGFKPIASHYDMIAADANNDGRISGLDLIAIRRALLGTSEIFPNDQLIWRFVDASSSWPAAELPFPFSEEVEVTPLADGVIDVDFMAIKIGDVNSSNDISKGISSKSRSTVTLEAVQNGNRIDFISTSTTGLYGFQMSLDHANLQTYISSDIIDFSSDNYNIQGENILISWEEASSPIKLHEGDVLFSVYGSSNVNITDVLESEWIANDFSISNIALSNKILSQGAGLTLISNHPNPFTEYTDIDFELTAMSPVHVELIDISGRQIFASDEVYQEGQNTYRLNPQDFNLQGGVYIVKFSTPTASAIHKVTLVK